MFFPIWLILALLVRLGMEYAGRGALPGDGQRALPILCLAVAAFLSFYCVVTAVDALSRRVGGARVLARGLRLLCPALPVLFYYGTLHIGGWEAFVRFSLVGQGWVLFELAQLAPFFLFEALALVGELLLSGSALEARRRMRSTWLVVLVFTVVFGVCDLMLLHPLTRAALAELPIVTGCLAFCLGFLVVAALFPALFALLFRARELPAEDAARLMALVRRSGVRVRRICWLDTGGSVLNAAVVGNVGWTRHVVFTDLMVECFSPRQLEAVLAHELAHVKRWHLPRMLLFFVLLPTLLAPLIATKLPLDAELGWLVALALVAVVAVPLYGWLSRRFEHEADYFGAQLLGSNEETISALKEVGQRLHLDRDGLRHPSLTKRVAFLESVALEPERLRRFFRGLVRVQAQLLLVLGLAVFLAGVRAVDSVRSATPDFLLTAGWPTKAFDIWKNTVAPSDAAKRELQRSLGQAVRAQLLLHGESEGPGRVSTLRRRALQRADRALAARDWDAVLGWYDLVRRWGEQRPAVTAIHDYLDAEWHRDRVGMERARRVLARLESLPEPIKRAIDLLP